MIVDVAARGVGDVSPYDSQCVVREEEEYEVFLGEITEDEAKGWEFPDTLTQSLPTMESLILPEIARLEQQFKNAMYFMWESVLSPEDKREIRTAARRILEESRDIAETAKMLRELGK